jgi:hypothetical protein
MPTEEPIPLIRREDYEAFKRLMGEHLPDTYEGWLQLATNRRNECIRNAIPYRDVDVYPDKFAAWCTGMGMACDGATLSKFARGEP